MNRTLLAVFAPLALLVACEDPSKGAAGTGEAGQNGIEFWPPEAARGDTFDARITGDASIMSFDNTTLDLGDEITVNSVTVLDSWTAAANLSVSESAELGARDATLTTGEGSWSIPDALTIVADSFDIEPDRARIGESVEVEIIGTNTEWEEGVTWAGFGADIDVIAVEVLSPTYATATLTVSQDAVPGLRDVYMQTGSDITTAYDAFTVDRVALSATFEPTTIEQGETVEFTVRGSGTHFDDDTELTFYDGGFESGDLVIESITVLDAENLWGRVTASNAAELGMRDVLVTTDDEGAFIGDAVEVVGGELDLEKVAISLWFDVTRSIDNSTGAISESVSGGAVFYIPLDPPCGSSSSGDGPMPYDANGVFAVPDPPPGEDCPTVRTVGAGDHVWFESPCNVVTFDKYEDAASGLIYYTADLTLEDYCFDQMYDLHTEGEEGAIGEYILEEVQPTVPSDFELLDPQFWGDLTVSQAEDFTYQWSPALTYGHDPEAFFVTQISGTLVETGKSGFAGSLPWDDGEHTYTSDELSSLEPGNVSFAAVSTIPEGPTFGFPFSIYQSNYSSSSVSVYASMVLE